MPISSFKLLFWSVWLCCGSDCYGIFEFLFQSTSLQQYVWSFHPSSTTALVCLLLCVLLTHTYTDAHMPTPTPKLKTLSIFPTFPSPQQNTNVGNESAAARNSKPEKSLASAKWGLTTELGGSSCKRAYKKTTNQNMLWEWVGAWGVGLAHIIE